MAIHGHYTRFITTTKQSAPSRHIGTFDLAVGAAWGFLGSHVPYKSLVELRAAYTPDDISQADPRGRVSPWF
jgi:hypothetical protein